MNTNIKMNETIFVIAMITIVIITLFIKNNKQEGYTWPCTNFNNWSNDLRPHAANCAATPWSVAVPSWIGQLDQGNGRIGDDSLSGYAYYKAY